MALNSNKTLPKVLEVPVLMYFFNRSRQSALKWNKEADLNRIEEAAHKAGFRFSAASGTFFFTKYTKTHRTVYILNDRSYPTMEFVSREKRK